MASETLPTPQHKAILQITHLFPISIKRPAISNNFTPSHPIYTQSHPSLFLPAFPNLLPFVKIGLKSNPRLKWLLASEPSGMLSFMWLISHTQQTLSHDLSSCVLSLSLTFKCLPLLLCPALSSLQVVDSDSKFLLQYLARTLHYVVTEEHWTELADGKATEK